jgi:hypothetical protein
MASLASQYTSEIYEQRRYWATWEPNVHLELGTCGPVSDGIFRPEDKLGDFGITFAQDTDPEPADTDYSSRQGLDVTFQLAVGGQVIPSVPRGTAGMSVSFTRKQAVVVAVKGGREYRIANQTQLKSDILEKAREREDFPDRWFVVTHLVVCDFASVLVALGSGASFAVSGKADFAAGVVDLANAKLGLTVRSQNHIGYKMLAQKGATPLFRGLRLKRNWRGTPQIEALGPNNEAELASLFEELDPNSVIAS